MWQSAELAETIDRSERIELRYRVGHNAPVTIMRRDYASWKARLVRAIVPTEFLLRRSVGKDYERVRKIADETREIVRIEVNIESYDGRDGHIEAGIYGVMEAHPRQLFWDSAGPSLMALKHNLFRDPCPVCGKRGCGENDDHA